MLQFITHITLIAYSVLFASATVRWIEKYQDQDKISESDNQ